MARVLQPGMSGGAFGRPHRVFWGALSLAGVPLAAAHALRLAAGVDAPGTLAALAAGLVLGALGVDALTGLVHWACDTWGDARTPWLGPGLIAGFREHHRDPRAMLAHDWITVNREPAVAASAALGLLALPPLRAALDGHVFAAGFAWAFIVYGGAANQLHLWAHADRPPRLVRLLQRAGLVLSPARHARHHHAPRDSAYCISTGWMNPLLDRIGFWRALERGVSRLSGARPRRGRPGG